MNYKNQIPNHIAKILETLNSGGYEAYVVGGAVRDILLEAEPHDFDVTTSALPEETEQMFSAFPVYKTGIKHGTVTVNMDGELCEITTFRTDGEYKDGRHPESVSFTKSIEDDLARRDFTVNAMAMSASGEIIDPFNGQKDLEYGIIRAVGDPKQRFSEDALRIMRCYRFAATLGFDIAKRTLDATRECREGLKMVSKERIAVELEKLLSTQFSSGILKRMYNRGILRVILPELDIDPKWLFYIDRIAWKYPNRLAALLKDVPLEDLHIHFRRLCTPNKVAHTVRRILYWVNDIRTNPEFSPRLMAYECQNETMTVAKIAGYEGSISQREIIYTGGTFNDPTIPRSRGDVDITSEEILAISGVEKKLLGALSSRILVAVIKKECKNKKASIAAKIPELLCEIESDICSDPENWRKAKKYNFK